MTNPNLDDTTRYKITREAYKNDDPAVEPEQFWVCYDLKGRVLRRIKILALYPKYGKQHTGTERIWIYEEYNSELFRLEIGRLGICPEFNLRYVFVLESEKQNEN